MTGPINCGDSINTAMEKINRNFAELQTIQPDTTRKLMDMQKRLIDQLTAENQRLLKELDKHG